MSKIDVSKIERNDEEWVAIRALEDVLTDEVVGGLVRVPFALATYVEYELLKRGYTLTKIPPVNI